MTPGKLTETAQQAVAAHLHRGDRAIDATAGNGHDTLFLARCVAPDGRVIAFDVQPDAIGNTAHRLQAAGLHDRVELLLCGHEHLRARLPADWPGTVAAVMFNLGYLPGSDKKQVTVAVTTLAALDQALQVLRPGGLISLLVYRGHAGADAEVLAVQDWVDRLGDAAMVEVRESPGPLLYLIERRT